MPRRWRSSENVLLRVFTHFSVSSSKVMIAFGFVKGIELWNITEEEDEEEIVKKKKKKVV